MLPHLHCAVDSIVSTFKQSLLDSFLAVQSSLLTGFKHSWYRSQDSVQPQKVYKLYICFQLTFRQVIYYGRAISTFCIWDRITWHPSQPSPLRIQFWPSSETCRVLYVLWPLAVDCCFFGRAPKYRGAHFKIRLIDLWRNTKWKPTFTATLIWTKTNVAFVEDFVDFVEKLWENAEKSDKPVNLPVFPVSTPVIRFQEKLFNTPGSSGTTNRR